MNTNGIETGRRGSSHEATTFHRFQPGNLQFLGELRQPCTGLKSSRRFAVSGWWLCPAREPGYLVATQSLLPSKGFPWLRNNARNRAGVLTSSRLHAVQGEIRQSLLLITLLSDRKDWLTRRDGNRLAGDDYQAAQCEDGTTRLGSLISRGENHGSICQSSIPSDARRSARYFTLSGTKYKCRPARSSFHTAFFLTCAATDHNSGGCCQRARRHAGGINQVSRLEEAEGR
jgi:hypothetical protein